MRANFANTGLLTRFMLRRERVTSLLWILLFGGTVILLVPGLFYAIPADERFAIVDALAMPIMVSMIGPAFAAYYQTFGALYTNFMMLFSALTAALMNIFLIVRLTRADEEKGRYEVLRSLPVGRLSNLGAALLTAVLVNFALALFVGLAMFGFGLALYDTGMCLNGSLLWGVTLGMTGMLFAAFTALFAQLTASARTAMGYAFLALGILFLLRAPGDMNAELEMLALISPMGLLLRTEAYIGNNWLPIGIMALISLVFILLAFKLTAIRDIDQGLIPARPGRAFGSGLMHTPGGLVFKLTRTSMLVWLVSIFVVGASYGGVLGSLDEFIASNDMYQGLILGPFGITIPPELPLEEAIIYMREAVAAFGVTLPQMFSAMISLIMGIFATVPAALYVLKARSEENDTRAELILAASVSRKKYFLSFIVIAFIMAAAVQFFSALGMFLVGMGTMGSAAEFPFRFAMQSALIYVPAIWVKVGVVVFLMGALPKRAGLIWIYFAYTFIILFFGQGFGITPAFMGYLSPFAFVTQLPLAPGESINYIPLIIKTILALGLTFMGLDLYNRRDINAVVG